MAREKVDNKLNVVIGTKAQVEADNAIPENSIVIVTDEELTPSDIPQLAPSKITQDANNRFVTDTEKSTWNGKQNALGFTPENVANKVTDLNTPNNTTFGTTLAVKTYVDTEINALNISKHDIVIIPDTAFTITQAHFNKTLIITSSSDVEITVPTQIVENIEKGFFCDIVRYGTGEVSFSGAGIVLNSAGPLSIDAQYIAASLIKIDNNNEWLLIGGRE